MRCARVLAAVLAVTLMVAGCAPVDPAGGQPVPAAIPDEVGEAEPDAPRGADAITAYGCTVQTLLPQDSRETCGGRIVAQIFSGLAELDPLSGEPRLLVAAAIDTEDSVEWRIRIEDGWTFHNGEPVTARSFADAWNFAADPANDLRNREYFSDIVGYEELQRGDAESLAGLEVVDDLQLRVELREPFAPFLAKLTDVAFAPLPSIAHEDLDAYARRPIGNGRYELVDFDPEREAVLRRYEDWHGPDPAVTREVTFLIYSGDAALHNAYLDVQAGALDVLENIPPESLASVEDDVEGRVVRSPTATFTFIGLPLEHEAFGSSVDLRRALSLAIDREQVIETVFDGAYEPASSLIPPVLDAHRSDACESCRHDPDLAVELLEEAGGWEGPMTVHFNTGSGHEEWIEAVTASWREVLGISEFEYVTADFPVFLQSLESGEVDGPFRFGWGMSYLSPEYALSDLFRSEGSMNHFGYVDPEFDAELDAANAAPPGDANVRYQAAEDLVLGALPVIPLWYAQATSVHSERVTGVVVDASTNLRVERIEVVE